MYIHAVYITLSLLALFVFIFVCVRACARENSVCVMCSSVCDNVPTYLGTYGSYSLTLGHLSPIASLSI